MKDLDSRFGQLDDELKNLRQEVRRFSEHNDAARRWAHLAANVAQSSMLREELRKANDMLNEGEHGAESVHTANAEIYVSLCGACASAALITPASGALHTHCTQAARCRAATARASPRTTQSLNVYAASGVPSTTRHAPTVAARRSFAT